MRTREPSERTVRTAYFGAAVVLFLIGASSHLTDPNSGLSWGFTLLHAVAGLWLAWAGLTVPDGGGWSYLGVKAVLPAGTRASGAAAVLGLGAMVAWFYMVNCLVFGVVFLFGSRLGLAGTALACVPVFYWLGRRALALSRDLQDQLSRQSRAA